jgi:hypothetical protein
MAIHNPPHVAAQTLPGLQPNVPPTVGDVIQAQDLVEVARKIGPDAFGPANQALIEMQGMLLLGSAMCNFILSHWPLIPNSYM